MADGIRVLSQELEAYAVHLGRVRLSWLGNIRLATEVASRAIKDDARKFVRTNNGHIPHVATAINYDIRHMSSSIMGEIGYDRDKVQGNLAHIIEYGAATGYSVPNAPQRNLAKALDKNIENYMTGLQKAVIRGLV